MSKIQTTKNYALFKTLKGNRKLDKKHLQRLVFSIEKHKKLLKAVPIIINEKKQIIDGQHRFEACRALDLPVYYIEVSGTALETVQLLNSTSKGWTPFDYAKSYAELGGTCYKQYLMFRDKFPEFGHSATLSILGEKINGKSQLRDFKEGKLKIEDYKKVIGLAEDIREINEALQYKRCNTKCYIHALIKIITHEKYDKDRMFDKIETLKGRIPSQLLEADTLGSYIMALETIYNRGLQLGKGTVRFY